MVITEWHLQKIADETGDDIITSEEYDSELLSLENMTITMAFSEFPEEDILNDIVPYLLGYSSLNQSQIWMICKTMVNEFLTKDPPETVTIGDALAEDVDPRKIDITADINTMYSGIVGTVAKARACIEGYSESSIGLHLCFLVSSLIGLKIIQSHSYEQLETQQDWGPKVIIGAPIVKRLEELIDRGEQANFPLLD
jgi:hypothetical protein